MTAFNYLVEQQALIQNDFSFLDSVVGGGGAGDGSAAAAGTAGAAAEGGTGSDRGEGGGGAAAPMAKQVVEIDITK